MVLEKKMQSGPNSELTSNTCLITGNSHKLILVNELISICFLNGPDMDIVVSALFLHCLHPCLQSLFDPMLLNINYV